MTDFFTASPAERRETLLTFRDNDRIDVWQEAALTVADAEWGWGWWLTTDHLWSLRATEVKLFANRRKHAWIPKSLTSTVGAIGVWAREQRAVHASGMLSPWMVAELEGIPNWEWAPDTEWARNITAFDQFTTREGHGFVPRTHREGDSSLGIWVMAVRNAIAKKELPGRYERDIEARGLWATKQRIGFDVNLAALTAFSVREGHARVPVAHVESLINLGQWTNSQRNHYTAGTLSDERIDALEQVDGWVWRVQTRRTPAEIVADVAAARASTASVEAPIDEGDDRLF